jgi:hypothetical protein
LVALTPLARRARFPSETRKILWDNAARLRLQLSAGGDAKGMAGGNLVGQSGNRLILALSIRWLSLGSVMAACKNFPFDFFDGASH